MSRSPNTALGGAHGGGTSRPGSPSRSGSGGGNGTNEGFLGKNQADLGLGVQVELTQGTEPPRCAPGCRALAFPWLFSDFFLMFLVFF